MELSIYNLCVARSKPHHKNAADTLLKVIVSIGTAFFLILALLVGFLALIFVEFPLDIKDEVHLINHFDYNQEALELVVDEALNTDLKRARRASYNIFGGSPRRPDDRKYEPLFRAMRRAKVQEVWIQADKDNESKIILVMGTERHVIDMRYFGYTWSPNAETPETKSDIHKEMQLAPGWSLFSFYEG